MCARKLDYYLREAETTIRSDCLCLRSFLLKNTKNDKVDNCSLELASKYTLKFEYVKGIKNTLADTMSRLVVQDPDNLLGQEPVGYQFGKLVGNVNSETKEEVKLLYLAPVTSKTKLHDSKDPIPMNDQMHWGISSEEILNYQENDKFCKGIRNRIIKEGSQSTCPYYMDSDISMRYVEDNKQKFETTVIPSDLSLVLLKLAHGDLGHTGKEWLIRSHSSARFLLRIKWKFELTCPVIQISTKTSN